MILRDFPLQKKCSVWVGNSSSTLVDKGGYDPRGFGLADSQVPFGLDAFKCYNCGVSAWMSSDGFCFPGRRMEPVEIFWKYCLKSELENPESIQFKKLDIHPILNIKHP